MNLNIQIKFECKKEYLKEITENLLSMSQGVCINPLKIGNVYFVIYSGNMNTIENMVSFLRSYYESGKVPYFEIGYYESDKLKYYEVEHLY